MMVKIRFCQTDRQTGAKADSGSLRDLKKVFVDLLYEAVIFKAVHQCLSASPFRKTTVIARPCCIQGRHTPRTAFSLWNMRNRSGICHFYGDTV